MRVHSHIIIRKPIRVRRPYQLRITITLVCFHIRTYRRPLYHSGARGHYCPALCAHSPLWNRIDVTISFYHVRPWYTDRNHAAPAHSTMCRWDSQSVFLFPGSGSSARALIRFGYRDLLEPQWGPLPGPYLASFNTNNVVAK